MTDLQEIRANDQRVALGRAIKELEKFIHYARYNSRFAVPGEVDNVLEGLIEVRDLMYGEVIK